MELADRGIGCTRLGWYEVKRRVPDESNIIDLTGSGRDSREQRLRAEYNFSHQLWRCASSKRRAVSRRNAIAKRNALSSPVPAIAYGAINEAGPDPSPKLSVAAPAAVCNRDTAERQLSASIRPRQPAGSCAPHHQAGGSRL